MAVVWRKLGSEGEVEIEVLLNKQRPVHRPKKVLCTNASLQPDTHPRARAPDTVSGISFIKTS